MTPSWIDTPERILIPGYRCGKCEKWNCVDSRGASCSDCTRPPLPQESPLGPIPEPVMSIQRVQPDTRSGGKVLKKHLEYSPG